MGLAQCRHIVGPQETAMPLQPAPGVSPESPLTEGGEAHRVQLPEPVLVAVAQVAGAPVPTGVLDAGVDGHGAVFALRRGGNSAGLGRLSMAHPRGWGRADGRKEAPGPVCCVPRRKPKGTLGVSERTQEFGPQLH